VTLAKSYEPYGSVLNSSGSASSIFAYAGEEFDTTGLIYLRARYLQPRLGIFTSRDPWGGDHFRPGTFNGFNYAGGNPIIIVDPSGRCYPPLEFLRQIEPAQGANLDQAILILTNPNSTFEQRFWPSAYIVTWSGTHATLVVGAGILAGKGVVTWGARFLGLGGAAKAAEFVSEHPNLITEIGRCIGDVWNSAQQAIQQAIQSQQSPPPAFSENLEAGLRILEQYEPEYAKLIRDGTLTLEELPTLGPAAGANTATGIAIAPDLAYPGSTAAAMYEEITHEFQGAMQRLAVEIEARSTAAEWIMKNSIQVNPNDLDFAAYMKGDIEAFINIIQEILKRTADDTVGPGLLHGK
jgi:RHS repeat-associated protein